MEIQSSQKFCIIIPLTSKIDSYETARLKEEIKNYSNKPIGIDLSFVSDCTIDFFESIKDFNISLFNIPAEIFALLTFMNLDKFINLYTTEEDFVNAKYRLLNRKFSIV